MKLFCILLLTIVLSCAKRIEHKCEIPSVTTASGRLSPRGIICPGDLIFEDNFDSLDFFKWEHEKTLTGGYNWEFQWYNNNRTNSFAKDGKLFIKPSLLSEQTGEEFLTSGLLSIHGGAPADICTNAASFGCERKGNPDNILNPIKSASLRTTYSFRFKYGRIEISAKMPAGDWLRPAFWLMPAENSYGSWPASGDINLFESRGNKHLVMDGVNIGTQQGSSTLHFGPYQRLDTWSNFVKQHTPGYDADFHKYQMEWTPDYLAFFIDGEEIGRTTPGKNGFWELGNYENDAPGTDNPWRYATKMAPFDQEFYIIMKLAVGGINSFPDEASNPHPKPWKNNSPTAARDFYEEKEQWLKTWALDVDNGENASLQVDYVKVWAI